MEYDLPDQISGAEPVPGGLKSTKIDVFRKLDQVINSMKVSVGIGDALGLFMLSPSLNFAHATLTNTTRYMEEVSAHVSAFRWVFMINVIEDNFFCVVVAECCCC